MNFFVIVPVTSRLNIQGIGYVTDITWNVIGEYEKLWAFLACRLMNSQEIAPSMVEFLLGYSLILIQYLSLPPTI